MPQDIMIAIQSIVRAAWDRGHILDIRDEAGKLQKLYPSYELAELCDMLFAEAVTRGVNASWSECGHAAAS